MKEEIKLFIVFLFLSSFFIRWTTWNEESHFALIRSIVEEQKFEIDSFYTYTGDRIYYKNHYFSDKAPGLGLLSTNIYFIWKFFCKNTSSTSPLRYYNHGYEFNYFEKLDLCTGFSMFLLTLLTSTIFSSLTVVLVYKFLQKFSFLEKNHQKLITFIYGFGTLIFPYSQVFLSHATATFFIFLSFYLSFSYSSSQKISFLSGLFAGFSILIDYLTSIIFIGILLFISVKRWKMLPFFLLGSLIGTLPLIFYNYSVFSTPFTLSFIYPSEVHLLHPINKYSIKLFKLNENIITVDPIVAIRILFFPERGLFFYYPITFLSFIGIVELIKTHKLESILILIIFILYILNPFYQWWGGFSFGPRYMTPLMPFLMLLLPFVVKRFGTKIVLLFALPSFFINILSLQMWEGRIYQLMQEDPRYLEKFENFQVLENPLLDQYLPLFFIQGPRSIILENLLIEKNFDIRLEPHSCNLTPPLMKMAEVPLFYSSIGIVTLKLQFLFLVVICIFLLIIWKDEILKKLNLNKKKKLLLAFCLLLLFIIAYLRVREFTYGKNWYAPEWHRGKIDNSRWMSQNATLLLFNKNKESIKMCFSFEIQSFNKTRNLIIYLNNLPIGNYRVEEKEMIYQEVNLIPGVNELKFYSEEGCERPTDIGLRECDLRCLSFKIDKIRIQNINNKNKKLITFIY